MGSTQALFTKAVPIILKECPSSHFAEVKQSNATKTISDLASQRKNDVLVQVSLHTKGDGRLKVLELQLTDEDDPYFLYQLEISEDSFHAIKHEQNLLVDFQQFPEKAIDLLQECIKCRNEEHPKFVAQLLADASAQHAIFNIIETNTFKHITHLSLQFTPGNDQSVKKYLATLVKHYKADAAALKQELQSTSGALGSRVNSLVSEATQLRAELEAAKLQNAEMVNDLKMHATQQLASERERWHREKEDGSRSWETQRRDLTESYERKVRDLTSELHTLKQTHANLSSHAQATDSTLASTTAQLNALTDQYTSLRRDYDTQSTSLRSLESSRFDLEKESEALRGKLMGLERVVQEKEEMVERMGELWREAKENKEKLEENMILYKEQSGRAEENLKVTSEEIKKGNDIISRLQTELRTLKSKLKMKNMVTIQQEKLVDERAETIESLQRELESARRAEMDAVKEKDDERRKVDALKSKLEESKTIIEENANVIDWLHKQLNREAFGSASSGAANKGNTLANGFGQINFDKYASSASTSSTRAASASQQSGASKYTYNAEAYSRPLTGVTTAHSTPLSAVQSAGSKSTTSSQIPRYQASSRSLSHQLSSSQRQSPDRQPRSSAYEKEEDEDSHPRSSSHQRESIGRVSLRGETMPSSSRNTFTRSSPSATSGYRSAPRSVQAN